MDITEVLQDHSKPTVHGEYVSTVVRQEGPEA